MTIYHVYFKHTEKLSIEIDADSPEDAERHAYKLLGTDAESVIDSDDVAEYVTDEQGKTVRDIPSRWNE